MKTRFPDLPNNTPLLVAGDAHREVNGRPACGQDAGGKPMTLAQALVFVQPVWCHQCFGPFMGGRQ